MNERQWAIPKIAFDQLEQEASIVIDVRSPYEFDEFSLPNAINLPILTNEERIIVGTVYKREGKGAAIKWGLQFFSEKITTIYETIHQLKEMQPEKKLIIVCARGGLRSRSVVSTLAMLDMECFQLTGGIRSYRESIGAKLTRYTERTKRFYIISGHTGSQKTALLQRLKKQGYPAIDLEGLAGHRGSVFGGIDLKASSQKQFEALLASELERYQASPYLIIEAESKRIGNIVLPSYFLEGKMSGVKIELNFPFEERVSHLLEVYQPEKNSNDIFTAFQIIKKRMQKHIASEVEMLLEHRRFAEAFSLLLRNYYDPKYSHANKKNAAKFTHLLNCKDLQTAVEQVKIVISNFEQEIV